MNDLKRRNMLLALHYIHPVPLSKLATLFTNMPLLDLLPSLPPTKLQQVLHISEKSCTLIHSFLQKNAEKDFIAYYAMNGIEVTTILDEDYPVLLSQTYDPPVVLYLKGDKSLLHDEKKIAIVGSRKASAYTSNIVKVLLPPLLKENFRVVSGLAKGADKMAHEATMLLKGGTVAVLGHGFDHLYPSEHRGLYDKLITEQLVVTEYPPYVSPARWRFPMRNRIISGLSQGVIVTEAEKKSGTRSTVDYAISHGREIFVVPGNIFSSLSELPHELASDGARLVWNGSQIVEELAHNFKIEMKNGCKT